ncbi:uncharacterized protein LOC134798986 [Cydia splendana]|uniref:uncharacterized protein LOC134798986 n=1 Tax=Cydia splendana TaxID=1100963 RepID=UPI00300C793A
MMPPLEIAQSPDYISLLTRYIENCYDAVNHAALDAESGTILTVAASDVFGGYLKMVGLPVTKLAYYNGDVPTKDAMKLFKYYNDIKDQLHTNGKGWSEPPKNIPKLQNARGVRSNTPTPRIKHPCKRLLYLNTDQKNVTMPLPSIDWKTRTMFVPLRNQPKPMDLKSPLVSSVLGHFHQVASACERSINPERKYFQGSFEEWVNHAVVPHLSDDDLYTGFKGILSLIDNNNLLANPECKKIECKKQHSSFLNIFHNMSKKAMVIAIILILELICCIPTLLYCVMKKKCSLTKSPSLNKVHIHNRKGGNKPVFYELSTSPSSSFHSETKITSRVHSSNSKKFMKNKVSSELSNATGSRRSYSSIDASTTADESLPIIKSSHQTIISPSKQALRYKDTETDEIDVAQIQTQVSKTWLPRSSSSTAKHTDDTGVTVTLSSVLPQDKSTSKVLRKSKRFKPRHVVPSLGTSNANYSSENIKENQENNISTVKELKLELFDDGMDSLPFNTLMVCNSDKTIEFESPRASRTHTKNSEIDINRSMKEKESQKRVDKYSRPRGEKSRHTMIKKPEVTPPKKGILKFDKTKASKIPKIIHSPRSTHVCSVPRFKRLDPESGRKSMIPKARQSIPERALDDSALASSSPRTGKLNVTL